MDIPKINNGKTPDEIFNARLLFWLPADTPYGNFQLKLLRLSERADELNRKVAEAFSLWSACRSSPMVLTGLYHRQVHANEYCVHQMRRIADEIIALTYCLSMFEANGVFPDRIGIDEIGDLMKAHRERDAKAAPLTAIFGPHLAVLDVLNEIANAYKHSFINSDHTLMATEEPCIHALHLKHNRLSSGAQFFNIRLVDIMRGFDLFYTEGIKWLRAYSERHCPSGAFSGMP